MSPRREGWEITVLIVGVWLAASHPVPPAQAVEAETDPAQEAAVEPGSAQELATVSELAELKGRIASVDPQRRMVTIASATGVPGAAGGGPTEVAFNDQTLIMRAGVRLQTEDLAASHVPVTIRYMSRGGIPTAVEVTYEEPSGLGQARGTVQSISLTTGELALQSPGLFAGGGPTTFRITETTLITQDGQRTYLAQVKAGDEVTVDYRRGEEPPSANIVTITTSAKPAAEKARKWPFWPWGHRSHETQRAPGLSGSGQVAQ